MLNIPRGKMCGEREPVGSSADYRYRDPTQDNFSAYPYREPTHATSNAKIVERP
jgi:hypothetical protein